MAKVIIAPGKYVQGAGELKNLGTYVDVYAAIMAADAIGKQCLA